VLQDAIALVDAGDEAAATRLIEQSGEPRHVALLFDALVRELYWKAKHVSALTVVAEAGIRYCLAHRDAAETSDERAFFGDQAKTLAANLGSFLWPGWDEEGIELSRTDFETGRRAAALNLQLAIELGRPAERVQQARWLVGAHCLAARDAAGALEAFAQAGPGDQPLIAGYVLLARMMRGEDGSAGEFDGLLATLGAAEDEVSAFVRAQLEIARRVLIRP
jgi:hypothetical protein